MPLTSRDRNVFCRLFAYRPRLARTPEEDFLTEAFAAILLRDSASGSRVLNELYGNELEGIVFSERFELRTQFTDGYVRPDMAIWDLETSTFVFQENKVGSPLEESQIKSYQIEIGKQTGFQHLLVVSCTVAGEPVLPLDTVPYKAISWSDVYKAVERQLSDISVQARGLWEDFREFLETKGMRPFRGIQKDDVEAVAKVEALRIQLLQLLPLIIDDLAKNFQMHMDASRGRSKGSCIYDKGLRSEDQAIFVLPMINIDQPHGVVFQLQISTAPQIMQKIRDSNCGFKDDGHGNLVVDVSMYSLTDGFVVNDPILQKEKIKSWYADAMTLFGNGILVPRKS